MSQRPQGENVEKGKSWESEKRFQNIVMNEKSVKNIVMNDYCPNSSKGFDAVHVQR